MFILRGIKKFLKILFQMFFFAIVLWEKKETYSIYKLKTLNF